MKLEWDENKRVINLQKHKIDFIGSKEIFDGYTVTFEDDSVGYDEQRFVTFGKFQERVVAVVHTERDENYELYLFVRLLNTKRGIIMQQSQTDWKKIDAMEDTEINLSELPEVSPEKFAKAIVRKGLKPVANKTQITLRIDTDVLNWFNAQGQGYQTNINALLKAYKDANQSHR